MSSNINQEELIEENMIDLKELFFTFLRYKYLIFIFIVFITSSTFIYVLSIPNMYKSTLILSSQEDKKGISGGLSSLASLAGVSLSGGSSKDPMVMLSTTLRDYDFNIMMIKKYDLVNKLENQQNLVFAFGIDGVYNFIHKDKNERKINKKINEGVLYSTVKRLNGVLSISSNAKTGLIYLSASLNDRFLAKELTDIYLKEIIERIKSSDMKEIKEQIKYYKKELGNTYDIYLKEQLSKSLSALVQKRVFSQANDFYFVSKLTNSRVSNIREKTKPKRATMLIASFIFSLVISVFFIVLMQVINKSGKDEKTV